MLRNCGSHEISVANTAVLLKLLHRLIDGNVLPREQAHALLEDAAQELLRDPKREDVHVLAADIIRQEIARRV
jgi:hypothetical protein